MMSMIRLLNTRPAHQAKTLKQAIENLGGYVFNLPVFEIQPVSLKAKNLDEFDWMIFLSVNAVEYYFQQKRTRKSAHIIAIGSATKSALEKRGVHDVLCPPLFSSDGILLLPDLQSVKNKKIAIICGENSKSILPETLKQRGAEVVSIICYRRSPIIHDMNLIFKKLGECDINYIVSTSLESYLALLALFNSVEHRVWLLQKTICVISDQMKKQAIADGFFYVVQAENATDEAIIKILYQSE